MMTVKSWGSRRKKVFSDSFFSASWRRLYSSTERKHREGIKIFTMNLM